MLPLIPRLFLDRAQEDHPLEFPAVAHDRQSREPSDQEVAPNGLIESDVSWDRRGIRSHDVSNLYSLQRVSDQHLLVTSNRRLVQEHPKEDPPRAPKELAGKEDAVEAPSDQHQRHDPTTDG